MSSDTTGKDQSPSTPAKLRLSWTGLGFLLILLPLLSMSVFSVYAWHQFRTFENCLNVEKSELLERRTRLAAAILDEMITQVQTETDRRAAGISAMQVTEVDADLAKVIDKEARSLAGLTRGCKPGDSDGQFVCHSENREDNEFGWDNKNVQAALLELDSLSQDRVDCAAKYASYESAINRAKADGGSAEEHMMPVGFYKVKVHGSAIAFGEDVKASTTNPPSVDTAQLERCGSSVDEHLHAPEKTLWSTYYFRSDGKICPAATPLHQEDYTDVSNPGMEWFYAPMGTGAGKGGNLWVSPYLDDPGNTYMITYSSIIRQGEGGKPIGVVTADISINQLEEIIEELVTGFDGFGALTYGDGRYIYHPSREYVKNKMDLLAVGKSKHDKDRIRVAKLARESRADVLAHVSTTTGEKSWLVVEPLRQAGWSLQNTFYKESFYSEAEVDRKRLLEIRLITSVITLVVLVVAAIFNLVGWNVYFYWILSMLASALLILGIGNTWDLALNETKPKNSEDIVVDSRRQVDEAKQDYLCSLKSSRRGGEDTRFVPTGIYIKTLELASSNELSLSGRIWQVHNGPRENCRDHLDELDSSPPLSLEIAGATMESQIETAGESQAAPSRDGAPGDAKVFIADIKDNPNVGLQFGRAKNVKFTPLPSEINEAGEVVVNWWFQADIIAEFDYSRYPLEVEYIDLLLKSDSITNNVVLVPDVNSYKFGSNRKAGLSEDIFVPGWDIFRSYFTLKKSGNDVPSFGMQHDFDDETFEELHFKIGLRRIFIDAFISNLTPLIVVAIILFSVALLPSSIDISRVLGICVSVFFVVVFSHLAIRRTISTGEIFYLEYFFLTIYLALLLVPVDAFREALGIRSRVFEYKKGLVYKVLYWPSLLLIFYWVTVFKFV